MTNKAVVPATVKNKIVSAFTDSMRGALDHTSFIHTVCVAVGEDYPEAVPAAAQRELVDALVQANEHWAERTGQERGREARAIMDTHHVLENYCDAVKSDKRAGNSFTWHNGVKVARIIRRLAKAAKGNKLPSNKAVCAAYYASNPANTKSKQDKAIDAILALNPASNLYKELVQVLENMGLVVDSE